MNADMQSVEELIQLLHGVSEHLAEAAPHGKKRNKRDGGDHDFDEAAPPPFKAAEREKAGMPALKGRSGSTPSQPAPKKASPPPLPAAAKAKMASDATKGQAASKHGEILYHRTDSAGKLRAGVDVTKKSFGTKHLGIKRGWAGASDNPAAKFVGRRAAQGESLSDTASEIRNLIGEAASMATFAGSRVSNQPIIRKPKKMILRPKPLVAAGSKLKAGTSAGPAM